MNSEEPVELAAVAPRGEARGAGGRPPGGGGGGRGSARRYLEFGLFEPYPDPAAAPRYDPLSAARVARAERLRRDLDLNFAGAVLVCELLDRIRDLEAHP